MATVSEPVQSALILAAGRGERMRPLTDTTPKPLLAAGGRRLIEWQVDALARAGVRRIVINIAHLPDQFEAALGRGERWGVQLIYSREAEQAEGALETLGGIVRALPWLGEIFIVASGDIISDFDYGRLRARVASLASAAIDGHLVLIDNPPFHPRGDMGLVDGLIAPDHLPLLTYANIGVFAARLFDGLPAVRSRLFPWLYEAARAGRISGEVFNGRWHNVGTPADLAALDRQLQTAPAR